MEYEFVETKNTGNIKGFFRPVGVFGKVNITDIVFSEDRKKKKIEEIVFSKMASIIASLNGFEFEKEKMDEILSPFITKYKLSDQSKNTINSLIQAK